MERNYDENDHNHLVIDEVTAPVVELIFSIAEEGAGLHTICNRLHKAKVMKLSFYKKELFERFDDEEKMYDWDTAYVSKILHGSVYAGNKHFKRCIRQLQSSVHLYWAALQ